MVWLDEWDAVRFVGRSHRTLRDWRARGLVKHGKRGKRWVYDKDSLRSAARLARARQVSQLKRGEQPKKAWPHWDSDPRVDPVLF